MTDQEEWPTVVTLAGIEVQFGEFEPGTRPAHDLDEAAEAAAAGLSGTASRLLRLVYALQTGVEAGVIGREHLDVVEAVSGGVEAVPVDLGDEKMSRKVAPLLFSSAAIDVAWWMLAHEPDANPHSIVAGWQAFFAAHAPDEAEEARLFGLLQDSVTNPAWCKV